MNMYMYMYLYTYIYICMCICICIYDDKMAAGEEDDGGLFEALGAARFPDYTGGAFHEEPGGGGTLPGVVRSPGVF